MSEPEKTTVERIIGFVEHGYSFRVEIIDERIVIYAANDACKVGLATDSERFATEFEMIVGFISRILD